MSGAQLQASRFSTRRECCGDRCSVLWDEFKKTPFSRLALALICMDQWRNIRWSTKTPRMLWKNGHVKPLFLLISRWKGVEKVITMPSSSDPADLGCPSKIRSFDLLSYFQRKAAVIINSATEDLSCYCGWKWMDFFLFNTWPASDFFVHLFTSQFFILRPSSVHFQLSLFASQIMLCNYNCNCNCACGDKWQIMIHGGVSPGCRLLQIKSQMAANMASKATLRGTGSVSRDVYKKKGEPKSASQWKLFKVFSRRESNIEAEPVQ